MAKLPDLTAEERAAFKSWGASLKKLRRKSGPTPEEMPLLGSPSAWRMARLGVPWREETLFEYWGDYHVKEAHKHKFLVVERNRTPRVLSIVRHYRDRESARSNRGEENAMTILHENPGKTNSVPAGGCQVGGAARGRPHLLDDEGARSFPANCQARITPIGKKGLCALHSFYQFCTATEILGGTFQRFLTGPSPEGAIRRAAFTLRKLAEADPKTTAAGEKALLRRLSAEMVSTAEAALTDLESAAEAHTEDDLQQQGNLFVSELPSISIGGVTVSIAHDMAYGPDPRTWAVSLRAGWNKSNAEENREAFVNAWQELSK